MRFLEGLERQGREIASVVLGKIIGPSKVDRSDLQTAFDRGQIRKILLVRNYQGMGDLLCATPVISSLKTRFPQASIHFLANTFNAAALQNNPAITRIWAWNERRKADPRQWFYFQRCLKREQFDLALVLTGNALSLTAILLADLSGARWVVGYETTAYGQTWGTRLYSYEVPYSPAVREIDKYVGLVEGLGIPCPQRFPEFRVTAAQQSFAETFWKEHFPSTENRVVGIFLGGKVDRPDRIWPAENFAEVARSLTEKSGCAILAITPPVSADHALHRRDSTFWQDESIHARKFRDAYGRDCPVFRNSDLGCVGAVLKKLTLLICPDGGIMHLAAALRVPTLTLFLGTHPEIWHPPVPSSYYVQAPAQDPQSLRSEAVVQRALNILNAS